jgi:putative transposase
MLGDLVTLEYSITWLSCAFVSRIEKRWLACRVLFKVVYLLVCRMLRLIVLIRSDLAKDAELWCCGMRTRCGSRPTGYGTSRRPGLVAVLARLFPRRRWAEVSPMTPATLLAWHRKPAAGKYDMSKRRKPGRLPTSQGIARLVVPLARENPL